MQRLAVRVGNGTVQARRDGAGRGGRDSLSDGLSDPLARPVQMRGGGRGGSDAGAVAARGVAGAGADLPHRDAIQGAFGRHDVSGVKAQVGGPAAEASDRLGATAFATGSSVGFAAPPDLHTAAHEAAHAVQQRRGVQLYGGVGRPGDPYERHADAVADAVVAGRSAEGLLDAHPGAGPVTDGVQREVKRSSVDKAQVALEGPAFGVPGLKWNVKAEGERELESEVMGGKPETTVKASVAGGLKYDLWCLEVGVDLQADVEVKVEGNESTTTALHRGVTEFARWYAASKLGDVADKRQSLENAFANTRLDVLGAYRELQDLLKNSSFKDFKTGATSWFYFTESPRQKVATAIDLLHQDIEELFQAVNASGSATSAALLFVDKAALLNDFASAANTDEQQAQRNIDRSRGRFLGRFDPAKASLLGAFDNVDKVKMLERDPQVQFTGTFGANLSGKLGWGGSGEGEGGNEAEASVGVGKRIQSGGDQFFDLGSQDVARGKLGVKVGPWGGEAKAEREKSAGENGAATTKWKLEVELKREGVIDTDGAEGVLDALKDRLKSAKDVPALAETCPVPDVLEMLKEATTSPAEQAAEIVTTGEGGADASLGGEVNLEFERPDAQAPFALKQTNGKVALAGFGGGKAAVDLGAASRLAKAEGSVQKGVKLSKSFGG